MTKFSKSTKQHRSNDMLEIVRKRSILNDDASIYVNA